MSLGFEAHSLHRILPHGEILAHRAREFGGRAAQRVDADLVEARRKRRVLAAGGDLARYTLDDLARRAGRRDIAVPGLGAKAAIALLGDRRDVLQPARSFLTRSRQQADPASACMRQELVEVAEIAIDVARHHL